MQPHLAQINIGTMVAGTDDPAVTEFMDALDRVNALADDAPGFVWRLQTDAGNATAIQVFPDPNELVNMSVWESITALKHYVYSGEHVDFFRRRAEWFVPDRKRVALWWVRAGERPELDDAIRRVEFLGLHGPSPYAFGFAKPGAPLLFEGTTPDDPDTSALISRLDAETDDPIACRAPFGTAEVTEHRGVMLRARLDGELVACGAIRRVAGEDGDAATGPIGEVGRLFVDPSTRGLKIGAAVLDQLELVASRQGVTELRVGVQPQQPAAIGLYERAGYRHCDGWDDHPAGGDGTMFYEKRLG